MTGLLCVGCLGVATVQVISPDGMPLGTYCGPCLDASRQVHDRMMQMLQDAVEALGA